MTINIFFSLVVCEKGSSINDVTVLGGGGGQGFCDDSTKVLVIKRVTMGELVPKIVPNCVTSFIFMDDPKVEICLFTSEHFSLIFLSRKNSKQTKRCIGPY